MQGKESPNSLAVNRALIAIAEGDVPGALEQFEEDAKWKRAAMLPYAGTHEGRDAIGKLLSNTLERMGGRLHVLDLTLNAAGEHVFADYTISPSADPYDDGSVHVLTVFDVVLGRIREAREFVFRFKSDAPALGPEV